MECRAAEGYAQHAAEVRRSTRGGFPPGPHRVADLIEEPTFRDFLCLYMAEGYKRSRNTVAVCNSDHRIVVLCARWIRRFTSNKIRYAVQYHADQDLDELRRFWAAKLAVTPGDINVQRKSNSGKLAGSISLQFGLIPRLYDVHCHLHVARILALQHLDQPLI